MAWEYISDLLRELQSEAEWTSKDVISEKAEKAWNGVSYVVTGAWLEEDDE